MTHSDPEYVLRQYRNASKPNARIASQVLAGLTDTLGRESAPLGDVLTTKGTGAFVAHR